ncbi:formimidoylglutamase [Ascidiimonas sp. W6]|uniref:formimidoylglutamase n=1 Tax=Ascidiimonas meishanensis TaxID=3128903 RepID=UPI0030EEE72D
MHQKLKTYKLEEIQHIIDHRKPDVKMGEKISYIHDTSNLEAQLLASKSKFVLMGVPEDIGIFGNYGKPGARFAWDATLKSLLNIQSNSYTKTGKLLLLGYLDYTKELQDFDKSFHKNQEFIEKARSLTVEIDKEVTYYIRLIVASGKKPIIIGGGHNNCYGILKGCALALNKPINAVNIDAHTDLRPLEGRHSGNGFSYAYNEGFLGNYFAFGVHEDFLSKEMLKKMADQKSRIQFNTYEELEIKKSKGMAFQINKVKDFITSSPFGIEVDCDSIINIPSSAMTPTGFDVNQVRNLVYTFGKQKNALYLHICEAAPNPENKRELEQSGKLISYLILDYLRK